MIICGVGRHLVVFKPFWNKYSVTSTRLLRQSVFYAWCGHARHADSYSPWAQVLLRRLSTKFILGRDGARRHDSPLLRAPRRGRPPDAHGSSRCRSGRVRPPRPSRCVRLRSRHTARGPGHTTHGSHTGLPHGGQQAAGSTPSVSGSSSHPAPLIGWACLMAEAPLALRKGRAAPAARPEAGWPLWAHNALHCTEQHKRQRGSRPRRDREVPYSTCFPRAHTGLSRRPIFRGVSAQPLPSALTLCGTA